MGLRCLWKLKEGGVYRALVGGYRYRHVYLLNSLPIVTGKAGGGLDIRVSLSVCVCVCVGIHEREREQCMQSLM